MNCASIMTKIKYEMCRYYDKLSMNCASIMTKIKYEMCRYYDKD